MERPRGPCPRIGVAWSHTTGDILNIMPKSRHVKAQAPAGAVRQCRDKRRAIVALDRCLGAYAAKYRQVGCPMRRARPATIALRARPHGS